MKTPTYYKQGERVVVHIAELGDTVWVAYLTHLLSHARKGARGRFDLARYERSALEPMTEPPPEHDGFPPGFFDRWRHPIVLCGHAMSPLGCSYRKTGVVLDIDLTQTDVAHAYFTPLNIRREARERPIHFGAVSGPGSLQAFVEFCVAEQDKRGWAPDLEGPVVLQLFGLNTDGFNYIFYEKKTWNLRHPVPPDPDAVTSHTSGDTTEFRLNVWSTSFVLAAQGADVPPGHAAWESALSKMHTSWQRMQYWFPTTPTWRHEGDEVVVTVQGEGASESVRNLLEGWASSPYRFEDFLRRAKQEQREVPR